MRLLLLVPLLVLVGTPTFIWHRLFVGPGWSARWVRYAAAVPVLLLTAAVLTLVDVGTTSLSPAAARPLVWAGQLWLAGWLYLAMGLAPVWLGCVAIWLRARTEHRGRALRRRVNRVASPLVAAAAVLVTGVGVWEAAHPSATSFEVRSARLPAAFDGTRVALVTDLHAGSVRDAGFTRRVVDLVNAQRPDLVVIAGDLVDGSSARYAPEVAPLADLRAPLGVYATTGNHEMYADTADWVRVFEALGVDVLANESITLTRGSSTIALAGVHDHDGSGPFAPDYDATLAGVPAGSFVLLAAHQPRQALAVAGRGVDLQLSGHTHGGQLWPFRYLVPLQQPMVEGLQTLGDVPTVTSRGAGAWGPPVRVGAPAEVPIVTLRSG